MTEQLRRIEASKRNCAAPPAGGCHPRAAASRADHRGDQLEEPVEHEYDGDPPADPDEEGPNADLPQALAIYTYGSLRSLIATGAGLPDPW